jgi:hypothetical protein
VALFPITEPDPPAGRGNGKPGSNGSDPEGFHEWWRLYPNKAARAAAAKAWRRAVKAADPADLLDALHQQLPGLAEDHARGYCPHGSTWLNNQRWTDPPRPQPETAFQQRTRQVQERLRAMGFTQ